VLIANVHKQHELEVGVLVEGFAIQREDLRLVRPRRNDQLDRPHTPSTLQPLHRRLEMGVVEIGIEYGITGCEAAVLSYQVMDRLSRVASKHDLVVVHAKRTGHSPDALHLICIELFSGIERILSIHHTRSVDVGILYRMSHLAPVAVLEVDDAVGSIVVIRYLGPEGLISSQC